VRSLENGDRKLILLDETLKGTNSKDKQEGSIALIEKLLKYPSVGFFATHDLALGQLAAKYPNNVLNRSFEISIQGDQMEIDYRLREGVCKNLNAAFLMHKMGIVD
jgi:DNA mismatch repair ATPase MutS